MKKILIVLMVFLTMCVQVYASFNPMVIEENDGSPSIKNPGVIKFENGSLTDGGNGEVTIGNRNTLDAAYDQGGVGSGASITADSGAITIIADTSANDGVILRTNDNDLSNELLEWQSSASVGLGSIEANGDVGIGTISPDSKLEVNTGTDGEEVPILTLDNNIGKAQVYLSNGDPEGDIEGSPGDLAVDVNEPATLYIKQTGSATTAGWTVASTGGNVARNYIYAFDTTAQATGAVNTFQDVTFSNNGQLNGWTHTTSTANFTATQTGKYIVFVTMTTSKAGGGTVNVAMRALFNGTEIPGSYTARDISANNSPTPMSTSFILDVISGQIFKVQFVSNNSAAGISLPPTVGTTPAPPTTVPSVSLTMVPVE